MTKKIRLYSNGKISESGYTREDLEKLIEDNQFSPGTLCSFAGAKRWLPLFFYLNDLSALATPLAYPLKVYIEEKDSRIKLWAMIDFCEMLCRMLTFTFLAEREKNKSIDQKTRSQLARLIDQPSFASWLNCALKLIETHQPPPALQRPKYFLYHQLRNFLQGEQKKKRTDETSLIELRNRMAHFGPMPKIEADRMLSIWEEKFDDIITHTEWLVSFTLLGKTKDDQWSMIHSPEGKTTPFSNPNLPKEEEPDAVWLKIEDLTVRLWPMAAFGRPSLEEDLGDRTIEQEHSQIYVRREQVRLGYFPVGAQGIGKSDSSLSAREAYDRIFPTQSLFNSKDFQVNGLEGEILQEAHKMVGRAEQLGQALKMIGGRKNGVLWIDGLPGMGKSALMAKVYMELIENLPIPNQTVLPYRFRANDQDRCNRNHFAQYVIERLMASDALKESFKDQPKEKIEKRLEDAFAQIKEGRTLIFLLDGLDEINLSDPSFVEEIPLSLRFSNILWFCASRPEPTIKEPMHRLSAERVFPEGLPPMNHVDVRAMFMEKLGPLQRKKLILNEQENKDQAESAFIRLVTKRAGGLPLYVVYAIGDVLNGTYRVLDGEENLPPSLDAYHAKLIKRLGIGALADVLTPLAAGLAVAREPLSKTEILQLLLFMDRVEEDETDLVEQALLALSGMLTTAPDPEGEVGYRLFHQSLKEHILGNPEMSGPVKRARRTFADMAEKNDPPPELRNYLLRCGIDHLLEVDRKQEAEQLLLDLDYLYAMNQQGVETLSIYQYWNKLEGEKKAILYIDSVKNMLSQQAENEAFRKAALVSEIARFGLWNKINISIEKLIIDKSLELGLENQNLIKSYQNMGRALTSMGNVFDAIRWHKKAKILHEKIYGEDHPASVFSYIDLGEAFHELREFKKALNYYRKAISLLELHDTKDFRYKAICYSDMGLTFSEMGEHNQSIVCHQNALEIKLTKLDSNHPDIATSYNNIGYAHALNNNYSLALEFYKKAIQIEHPEIGSAYNNLGDAYYKLEDFISAATYFEKSLSLLFQKNLNPLHIGSTKGSLINIMRHFKIEAIEDTGVLMVAGNSHLILENFDKAIEYFKKVLASKSGFKEKSTLGQLHKKIGKAFYEKAFKRLEDPFDIPDPEILTTSTDYLRRSLPFLIKTFGIKNDEVIEVYKLLGHAYTRMGDLSGNEFKDLARWSELRAKGEFASDVDSSTFERKVARYSGMTYEYAQEIEEELKAFPD